MPSLQEIRQKYPQYQDMSDQQLADALYKKSYSDMPREQFNKDLGMAPPKTRGQAAKEMVTDIPKEITSEIDRALEGIKGFGDWAKGEGQEPASLGSVGRGMLKAGGALGSAAYIGSGMPAIVGATKSVVGHGGEAAFGPENVDYEGAKEGMDVGVMAGGAAQMLRGGARALLGKGGKMEIPPEPAASQGPRAAERIARGFDPGGQMLAESPEQAAGRMSEGIRKAEEYERQSIAGEFKFAGEKPAAINAPAFMVLPQNITKDLASNGITLIAEGSEKTTYANMMLKDITREVAKLSTTNRGGPAAGRVTNVNLSAIDAMKRRLNTFKRAAFETRKERDIKAAQGVLEAFDNHIDQMVNSKAFVGDTSKVKAWNTARERETLHRKTFETDGRKSVGEVVAKVIGDNRHDPMVAQQVADHLWGSIGTLPSKFNVSVAQRFKSVLGADSLEWAAGKQGLWQKVVSVGKTDDWQPRMIKDRVLQFLDGDGKEMASFMYSGQERSAMRQFANIQGSLDVAGGSAEMQTVGRKVTGAIVGMLMSKFDVVATAVHAGKTFAEAYKLASKEFGDLQVKLPKVRSEVEKWKAATERAQKHNAGLPRERRLQEYRATVTLSQALRKLGVMSDVATPQMANQSRGEDKLSANRAMGGPAM